MLEEVLLVCDEHIDISRDVKLLCIDGKWQLCYNGGLEDGVWDEAMLVCKGLGILINKIGKIYKLIWETGECKEIKGLSEIQILREVSQLIVDHIGLKGLSERAFVENGEIFVKKRERRDRKKAIELYAYVNNDGSKIYRYQILGEFYYGMLNKDKTDWLVELGNGYINIECTKSGVIIFNSSVRRYGTTIDSVNSTRVIYRERDVIEPFYGRLHRIGEDSDLYRYEYRGNNIDTIENKINTPLIIGDKEYKRECILRITKGGIEVIVEFPKDTDKFLGDVECKLLGRLENDPWYIKYYSEMFMFWGVAVKLGVIGDYELESSRIFYGYALNIKGEYHFDKNMIYLVRERANKYTRGEVKDILAYFNDNGIWRGMIITPELGKVMYIEVDDKVYREKGGWLKVESEKNGIQQFIYNGNVYEDMGLEYNNCEEIEIDIEQRWDNQCLYVCQCKTGNWMITTEYMEPIGYKRIEGYSSKEGAIAACKNMLKSRDLRYFREQIGVIGERELY